MQASVVVMCGALAVAWAPVALADDAPQAAGASAVPSEPDIHLEPLLTGASEKAGYYMPSRVELGEAPKGVKTPDGLTDPVYATLTIRDGVALVWGKSKSGGDVLIVDTNRNQDLTDDAPAKLTPAQYGAKGQPLFTRMDGTVRIDLGTPEKPHTAGFIIYRFDPTDPQRAQLAKTMFYYRDYGYTGTVKIGTRTFRAMLMDERSTGSYDVAKPGTLVNLCLDVNDNGRFDYKGEIYDVTQAFNISGTVYEVKDLGVDGSSFRLAVSDKKVDEVPPPPDHEVGKRITSFSAATMEGKNVDFPGDYAGKIVMLDFWATWCQPCMLEVPGLVEVANEFKDRGFVVLGVTLDQKNAETKIARAQSQHEMKWPQVYDGGYWQSRVPSMYGIQSIPAAFLVDGDSGKIIAMGKDVRGDKLRATVEAAVKAKGL